MRDDTHTASSKAVSPVPAAVTTNHESALRRSVLRRQGLSDLEPGLHDLDPRSFPASDQRNLELADGGVCRGRLLLRAVDRFPPGIAAIRQSLDRGQSSEERFVHGDATHDRERPAADHEGFAAREREKLTFRTRVATNPTPRAGQRRGQSRLEAAMFVPEMTGAENPASASWICSIDRPVRRMAVPA